jgi:predicted esterase
MQVINWARDTFPNRPLFAIGFSLGANILTNVRLLLLGILKGILQHPADA